MLMCDYKSRSSSSTPSRHTDTRTRSSFLSAMAPSSSSSSPQLLRLSDRDSIRLRKPAVEKMRRDRINGCIEQLKLILEKEFQQQEPNSKLEKADILEMTVSFLRQQLQQGLARSDTLQLLYPGSCSQASAALQALQPQPLLRARSSCSSRAAAVWRPW